VLINNEIEAKVVVHTAATVLKEVCWQMYLPVWGVISLQTLKCRLFLIPLKYL
jgi:hypothetical protein